MITPKTKRKIRHKRVRAKIIGTSVRPRLSVFRSNKYMTLQLIDDKNGKTLLSITDFNAKAKKTKGKTKVESSKELGVELAKLAKEKKIKEVVFDRGGYKFHGRVKAVADGVIEGGIKI